MWISAEIQPPLTYPFLAYTKEGFQCVAWWEDQFENYVTGIPAYSMCNTCGGQTPEGYNFHITHWKLLDSNPSDSIQ